MQRDRFQIQPDTRIEIDEPGAIELLCRPFAKHDKGLPEWVKNAAGAYDRLGAALGERVIVLLRCCRAFAEDEHQDPERRAEWAEWARRVEEALGDE